MGFDLSMLERLADPSKASEAAAAGLPTIDLSAFKEQLSKTLEVANLKTMENTISSVVDEIGKINKTIEEKMAALAKNPKSPTAANQQKELDNLKAAKEHAISTGNPLPMIALNNPTLSLKSLKKSAILPPGLFD